MKPSPPWWVLVSSAAAPVVLIGGWTLAARRQPDSFDSTVQTISALAARNATDRWLMTAALCCVGAFHLVTALGLSRATLPGRVVLGAGGAATILVALFPLPAVGTSTAHAVSAAVAFAALAVWPAFAWRRHGQVPETRHRHDSDPTTRHPHDSDPTTRHRHDSGPTTRHRHKGEPADRHRHGPGPVALRPVVSITAALVLLGLVTWFATALGTGGRVGLAERFAAGAQACWPLAAALSSRLHTRGAVTARPRAASV